MSERELLCLMAAIMAADGRPTFPEAVDAARNLMLIVDARLEAKRRADLARLGIAACANAEVDI